MLFKQFAVMMALGLIFLNLASYFYELDELHIALIALSTVFASMIDLGPKKKNKPD